jgi:adenine-specific DNA-methyltransferase
MTQGVKYIGSKAALLEPILSFVEGQLPAGAPKTILDVFTGTTRVAQAFRAAGWTVTTSDLSWAAEAYANAFVMRTSASDTKIGELLRILKRDAGSAGGGWIETNYCDVSGAEGGLVRMWRPTNGRKADAVRDQIAKWEARGEITRHEAMILVACLIFALDKVDNSVGVQQAYLKSWAARTANPLELVDLPYPNGPVGRHIVGDALKVAYPEASIAYLDPPYSSHSYATYYHIWDSITRWDKPTVGLKTNRRIDRVSGSDAFDEGMSSPWNSKREALGAFLTLVDRLPVKVVVISYNDESLVPLETLEKALKEKYGRVTVQKIPYKRNIMSQIGNAALTEGEKKTENNEVLIGVVKV